jgi:hypothetical protein
MRIIITTLSFGENYTKDYTLRMIEDVLSLTDVDMYITTDCRHLIEEKYGNSDRIKYNEIKREDLKVSLPIGPNKGARDFNFNMRYLCLDHVKDIDDAIIIFTDCDNSFDWWNKEEILNFIKTNFENGYDYFAPRTGLKFKNLISRYNTFCKKNPHTDELDYDLCTIAWHKLFNYDLVDTNINQVVDGENHKWGEASFPSEYLIIFYNNNGKLNKMVEQWKWFYDYLNNKDYTFGTWAEGFEIGVSTLIAGFKDLDISSSHPIWSKVFTPNGYKTGLRAGTVHATEK